MTNYHHLIRLNHFVQESLDRLHIVLFATLLSTFQEQLVHMNKDVIEIYYFSQSNLIEKLNKQAKTYLIICHRQRNSWEQVTGDSIEKRDIMGKKLRLIDILDGPEKLSTE